MNSTNSIRIALLFVSYAFMFGCKDETPQSVDAVTTDYDSVKKDELKLSEIYWRYEFIVLESSTGSENTFGEMNEVKSFENSIVIYDEEVTNRLFVYDTLGRFKYSTRVGKGPGEVANLEDFCLDQLGNLFVLDNGTKKVLKFRLDDGKFLESFTLESYYAGFEFLSDHQFVFRARNISTPYKLLVLDIRKPADKIAQIIEINDANKYMEFGGQESMIFYDTKYLYFSEESGTGLQMISLADMQLSREFIIDFGPTDLRKKVSRSSMLRA